MSRQNHRLSRLKKLYELSMEFSGEPMDIFLKIARTIGEIMDIQVVCLSEIRERNLHFLSVYVQGEVHADAGGCPLEITPCATVKESKDIRIYHKVMELFPRAVFLRHHNAYSYCGFPSLDHNGNVVAVTCLLDDRPREFSEEDKELLQIFGQRIGFEIERKNLQDYQKDILSTLVYSEQRFKDIAKATGELVWEVDSKGRITYLSDLSQGIFGYPANELLGKNLLDLLGLTDVISEHVSAGESFFRQYLSHGLELQIHTKNGSLKWLRISPVQVFDTNGETIGYRGTVCDITDSKRNEEALLAERNRLRNILDSLSLIFIALLDRNGKIIESNRTPIAAAKIKREEYIGIQFGDSRAWSYDPEVKAKVRSSVKKAMQGQAIRYEAAILMANGLVHIDFSLVPLFDDQGRVEQIVACGVDISMRKKVLDALRKTEERLELAINAADMGLWDWDVQTGIVEFSEGWSRMLGYAKEEIQPTYMAWEKLVHPDDLPNLKNIVNDNLCEKTPSFEAEYRILSKNEGWKWFLAKGKTVKRTPEGKALRVTGIDMDISHRKELEALLRQRQDELYYAQRLTAAGELTAIVAHELNQPLGAIGNYVGGALLRYAEILSAHPPLKSVFEETLKLSQRAMAVIQGIRSLVRKRKEKTEWVSLAEIVDEILIPLRGELITKQVTLCLELAPTLPLFWCEKVHLQQLLLNLILNAIQAMNAPECVYRKLTICAKVNTSRQLEMMVNDTGPGIAPEISGRLFEPFLSTKTEGIGLGLSICRTIAEAYGGRISFHSMPRQGTAFKVVLPLQALETEDDR